MGKLNAFVTGATGLVGSHLLVKLIENNYHVKALYRNGSKIELTRNVFSCCNFSSRFNEIEWLEGDVLDADLLHEELKGMQHVFNVAAIVSFIPEEREQMLKTNVEGTANMVNASLANNIVKFCHISSVAALGDSANNLAVTENNEFKENKNTSVYAISKYLSELEVWRGQEEGLNVLILNPSLILGDGFWNSTSGQLFGRIANGFNFYTNGIIGVVDVKDVVKAALLLMQSEISGQRYILSNENITYRDLFNCIADGLTKKRPAIEVTRLLGNIAWRAEALKFLLTGVKPLISKETINAGLSTNRYDSSKIKQQLNFSFTPFEDTIKRLCNLFLQN